MALGCKYWWDDTVKFGLTVTSAPASEPVTAAEVKANARIDIDDDDTLIENKIKAARQLAETFLKRAFVSTTFRLTLDELPEMFYLPRPPLASVTSFKYYDTNGTQQTLATDQYTVDTYTEPGRILPAYNVTWPTYRSIPNTIEIIYVAGYGVASAVPQSIKEAITLAVTQWYEFRGDEGDKPMTDLPRAAKALLRANAWGYLP